jgi:hypothetical protein
MEFRTTDSVLSWAEKTVRERDVIDRDTWLEVSQCLNVLRGEDQARLFEIQQAVAKMRVGYIENGDSVAKADAKVEASDMYVEMQKQKAKLERIEETIRISKIHARMADDEFKQSQ